eukprot:3697888-Prymnesium_polylepis.1
MRPKPGRLARVLKALAAAVAAGVIEPGLAASLAGKLQFLLVTAAFGGKIAKAALHALRAAGRRRRRSHVGGWLRASIAFATTVPPLLPVRRLRLRDIIRAAARPPVVVWSDA